MENYEKLKKFLRRSIYNYTGIEVNDNLLDNIISIIENAYGFSVEDDIERVECYKKDLDPTYCCNDDECEEGNYIFLPDKNTDYNYHILVGESPIENRYVVLYVIKTDDVLFNNYKVYVVDTSTGIISKFIDVDCNY